MRRIQHRLAAAIFLWLWAAFALALGIAVLVTGEFSSGRRGPTRIVAVETEPVTYWIVVGVTFAAAVIAAWFGVREFRAHRRGVKAGGGER